MKKEDIKTDENTTESRREFLKTAGKFAVYTPPALMIMSQANAEYTICKSVDRVCYKEYVD